VKIFNRARGKGAARRAAAALAENKEGKIIVTGEGEDNEDGPKAVDSDDDGDDDGKIDVIKNKKDHRAGQQRGGSGSTGPNGATSSSAGPRSASRKGGEQPKRGLTYQQKRRAGDKADEEEQNEKRRKKLSGEAYRVCYLLFHYTRSPLHTRPQDSDIIHVNDDIVHMRA
jgi:hypothetical protein